VAGPVLVEELAGEEHHHAAQVVPLAGGQVAGLRLRPVAERGADLRPPKNLLVLPPGVGRNQADHAMQEAAFARLERAPLRAVRPVIGKPVIGPRAPRCASCTL